MLGENYKLIHNFNTLSETQRRQAAQMLTDELPLGWPTLADAMGEIDEMLNGSSDALILCAVENNDVIGWAGLLRAYCKVFELHPLVVRHDRQREGIATTLVNEIARAARKKGGLTLLAGADDEKPGGETSLANVNLYDDLPGKMAEFDPGAHQSAFFMKQGFRVVGVVPDANGIGKPGIQLAKRLYI